MIKLRLIFFHKLTHSPFVLTLSTTSQFNRSVFFLVIAWRVWECVFDLIVTVCEMNWMTEWKNERLGRIHMHWKSTEIFENIINWENGGWKKILKAAPSQSVFKLLSVIAFHETAWEKWNATAIGSNNNSNSNSNNSAIVNTHQQAEYQFRNEFIRSTVQSNLCAMDVVIEFRISDQVKEKKERKKKACKYYICQNKTK